MRTTANISNTLNTFDGTPQEKVLVIALGRYFVEHTTRVPACRAVRLRLSRSRRHNHTLRHPIANLLVDWQFRTGLDF